LSLTQAPSLFRLWREEENNYEAEEVKEKDPATRKTLARRLGKTGRVETQIAAGGDGKSLESCEKVGCPRHCVGWKEVPGTNNGSEQTQEETESFTGTACSTRSRDESPMGCEASYRRE
jgi:hypothetical protein